MPPVMVTALKTFAEGGRLIQKGEAFPVDPPVRALVLARQGLVNLSKITTRDMKAPEPEPEPEVKPRLRRRYRRRDMQAEAE